jgi:hypothetical protein
MTKLAFVNVLAAATAVVFPLGLDARALDAVRIALPFALPAVLWTPVLWFVLSRLRPGAAVAFALGIVFAWAVAFTDCIAIVAMGNEAWLQGPFGIVEEPTPSGTLSFVAPTRFERVVEVLTACVTLSTYVVLLNPVAWVLGGLVGLENRSALHRAQARASAPVG